MTNPTITDAAREAAQNEFCDWYPERIECGHFVQLAMNAACAEKDKEIERLKADLLQTVSRMEAYADTKTAELQAEIERLNNMAAVYSKDAQIVMAQRDSLKSKLTDLEGIAKEFSRIANQVKEKGIKSCSQAIEGSLLNPEQHSAICMVEHAIARYTAYLERNK